VPIHNFECGECNLEIVRLMPKGIDTSKCPECKGDMTKKVTKPYVHTNRPGFAGGRWGGK